MKQVSKRKGTALFLLLLATTIMANATIRRVNISSTATSPNGSTWALAYKDLQSAINNCVSGDEVWVAQGTYRPSQSKASFHMMNGVKILGGFVGTETASTQRLPKTYITTLTIYSTFDGVSVITNDNVSATGVLDGFTVTGGRGDNGAGMFNNTTSSPTISNVVFYRNYATTYGGGMWSANGTPILDHVIFQQNSAINGAGMYNDEAAPIITNSVFVGNSASQDGGGMANYAVAPNLTNVVFYNNTAGGAGGAIFNNQSNTVATNCTFVNNNCSLAGCAGGVHNYSVSGTSPLPTPKVTNCVFYNNTATTAATPADLVNNNVNATITYSYLQAPPTGTGNVTATTTSPFVDVNDADGPDNIFMNADDGFRLDMCAASAIIDKGNSSAITLTVDLAAQTRKVDNLLITDGAAGFIDMGAYENQAGGITPSQIAGTIGNPHTIPTPQEMSPDLVTNITASSVAGATYTWQQSSDNVNWTAATPASTALNYTIPTLTTPTYFRRLATTSSYCNVPYASNSVFIKVVQSNGAITGTVRSKNGVPVKGITIQAVRRGTATSGSPAGYTYTTVTADDGTYTITPIYYGDPSINTSKDSFYVSPVKAGHTFDFSSLNKILSTTAPNVANVNFTDLTVYSIVGSTYQYSKSCLNQTNNVDSIGCPLDSVQMYNNGTYISTSSYLDTGTNQFAHGRYAVTVTDPGTEVLRPSYNSHVFDPLQNSVVVTADVKNVNFADVTTHTITGYLTADCNDYIGSATLEFADVLPNDAKGTRISCFRKRVTTDVNGLYTITLPARKYKVSIIGYTPKQTNTAAVDYVSYPDLTTFFSKLPVDSFTRDITTHDTTMNLIYHRPPVIALVSGLDTSLCHPTGTSAFALFHQGATDSFTLKIFQGSPTLKGNVGCLVTDSINPLRIFTSVPSNDNSNATEIDSAVNPNGIVVKLTGGTPNIIAPYNKTLFASYTNNYGYSTNFSKNVIVAGFKADTATFVTVSPQIPFLVLHDPPGDGSSSSYQTSQTTQTALRIYTGSGNSTNAWVEAKIGTKFEAGIGVAVETNIWGTIKGDLTVASSNTASNETILSTTTTQGFSTSSDPSLTGSDGDVYVGTAMNLIYSGSTDVEYNPDSCKMVSKRKLIIANNGFSTQYVATEYLIKNSIIPDLLKLSVNADSSAQSRFQFANQAKVWQQVLDNNAANKKNAAFDQNRTFSGGTSSTYTTTSSVTNNNTIEFSMAIDATLAAELGLEIGGSGLSGGVAVNFKTEMGNSTTTTLTKEITTSYTLSDKDNLDNFTLDVKKDPVYSTPVFALKAGRSSCPTEPGTQPRDEAQLSVAVPVVSNVIAPNAAAFSFKLGNTSESGETRSYKIYLDNSSNPDGAVVTIGGSPATDLGVTYSVNYLEQKNVVVTVSKAQSSNVYSYPNLRIYVMDDCNGIATGDAELASNNISAYFVSPCSGITLSAPTSNWVVNTASANKLSISITGYDLTGLSSVALEYAVAGTNSWNTAFTKTSADLNTNSAAGTFVDWSVTDLADGAYTVRLKLTCSQGIVYSQAVSGLIDRTPPALYGIPQPSNDRYVSGSTISFSYNESLVVNNLNNGQVALRRLSNNTLIPITVSGFANTIQIVPNSSIAGYVGDSMMVIVKNMTDIYGNVKTTADTSYFVIGATFVGTGNKALSLAISQTTINKNATGTMDYKFVFPAPAPNDIAVNYTVSGTALYNTDYTITDTFNIPQPSVVLPSTFNGSQGTIVIPKNATLAIMRVRPVSTSNSTGNKTVIVNTAQGGDYVLGSVNMLTGTILNTGVLPLQLLSFSGQLADGKTVMQWQTAQEINTSYFLVERSVDGNTFNTIGNVPAAGTGNNLYYYVDVKPVIGTNFYRLKMVDKDGKSTYSNIISVTQTTDAFELVSFSPSPLFGITATVKVTTGKAVKLKLTIIDIMGRIITMPEYTTLAGTNNIPLTLNQLSAGVYTIYASDGTRKTNSIKFMKQ